MGDPLCSPTPGPTPTDGNETTGRTGRFLDLLLRLVRTDQPESTKRALTLMAGATLCICTFGLTLAIEYQAASRGTVDGQLVFALLGVGAWTAALAGVAYRKPEDGGGK